MEKSVLLTKYVVCNWNSLKSIRKSEKRKAKFENEGYTLVHTKSDIWTSTLVYMKSNDVEPTQDRGVI